ncbi:pilus assembly protein TadE [Vibrio sp. 10N.286.49.C2]|uniref:TadE/TadG family type IV pilus assembly protein n=1 Tax=unclassified Vibrio TaxID=2614977 RepID=UPI000C84F144|nr:MULTISPECIES: TadE family protein [unclassified Vibrio]PMH31605.1 pilus assembly protein TadE [Vibrio sp. 10N.286.49.C2]PMH50627.1 pilus assembly protein TadE [Vibrio sp. 10N.286.49.B1]PMH82803.1 pilus assembly protein TadE [Vibrio sp. 10N.286.48.B7]
MSTRRRQLGVTSIEFALGGLVLMFSTLAIFESSYQIYVVNMTEYSLRETIRNTKIYQGNSAHIEYEKHFKDLIENQDNLWHFLLDEDDFSMEGKYFETFDKFIANEGHSGEKLSFTYDLAEITVTYRYSPMIEIWGNGETLITRTMVLNLEHEGWGDDLED